MYGSSADSKLYPVWAWQTGYRDYTRQALDDLGDRIHKFKAIAITGYYDCNKLAGTHVSTIAMVHSLQLYPIPLEISGPIPLAQR